MTQPLPVVVIGAGPVGLAAAAHLVERGLTPLILEAGSAVAASIRTWSHVQIFSPWKFTIDRAARTLLEAAGWQAPDEDGYPTGGEIIQQYLLPLSQVPALADRIQLNARVTGVTRQGYDKVKTGGRDKAPFLVRFTTPAGEQQVLARAVIDASGTWATPNPMGASGLPAVGETGLASRIYYGIPDVTGADRARYEGKRVLVVGTGHSAMNALIGLGDLTESGTRVIWAVRRPALEGIFGGGADDQLPARGALGLRLKALVDAGFFSVTTGFRIAEVKQTEAGLVVTSEEGNSLAPVDEVVVATGSRPDLTMLRELRLNLDSWLEAPATLAPLIDPNLHSCGTVPPHGAVELSHPEPDFYIIGSKSYGRAPTFLMLTGYEQARSVVAAIAGDWEAAKEVHLELPETGVCSGPAGCCDPAPAPVVFLDDELKG